MTITVFVGRNGQGKDMAAVEYGVLPCWQYGRVVVSNCSLYPEELGFSADLYRPLNEPLVELPRLGRHMKRLCVGCRARVHPDKAVCPRCGDQAVDVPRMHPDGGLWSITDNKGCGLLLSDITTAFPSRETMGLPIELSQTLQQLRKPDIAPVLITCPAFGRVDLQIRQCATSVVESYAWNPLGRLSSYFSERPAVPWGWPKNRAFERQWFDPAAYERAEETGNWEGVEVSRTFGLLNRPSRITWRRRDILRAQRAYDSFEDIELADHLACGECGGRLPKSSCKDPGGHREHSRSMRKQRDEAAFPITDALIAELSAPDLEDERLAEALGL